jgi:hypothetical protein
MAIPESQLEVWAKSQQTQIAVNTYNSIKTALNSGKSAFQGKDFDIYLQGSYRNSTNIRSDSDVDVILQFNSSFYGNKNELSSFERQSYDSIFSTSNYSWAQFRQDVLNTLQAYYGATNVISGNKSIKIAKGSNRLPADVVPSFQYRRYQGFHGFASSYSEGITFWTQNENRQVINYPKLHYQNGVQKNEATKESYKQAVRMFKNARNAAIDRGLLQKGIAPSYFLECLLYNVPDDNFRGSYQSVYANCLNYISNNLSTQFQCQNRQSPLFGASPEQWDIDSAKLLLGTLIELWSDF